jgi:Flp pilus assembly secretin CpaC
MKRFLPLALFVGSLSVAARVHAEDKTSPEPKHYPTAPPASNDGKRALLESAADKIALIKKDAARTLSPSEQTACLLMAADLAELGGSDNDAKHLRDEAAKDQPPTGILDLLTRRQAQLDALQSQVAALRRLTHTEQQVLVDVRMIEISRTKMRDAGLKLPDLNAKANGAAKDPSQAVEKSSGGAVLGIIDPDHEFFAFLDELRAKGIAKSLAEPAILTVSGRPAFFASGGEFPFLQRQSGETVIDFKRFGTQVNLVPLVLGNDKLRLEFKATVSEIDDQLSVNSGGLKMPGLHVRECDTGVEFASGQTVVVGGIIQQGNSAAKTEQSHENASSGKSTEPTESPQETELLVLVRARLVEPANEPLPTQPQHGYFAPSPATTTK